MAIQLPYTGVTTSETVPTPYLGSEKIQLPYTALAQAAFISAIDPSTKEDKSNKGIANGYAPLDANAKVPSSSLANPLVLPLGGSIDTRNLTGTGGNINTSNGGGSIDTSGGGGSILLTGLENQYFASNGGSIDLRALNAETSNGGSIIATGNYGYQGGTLNMSAGANNNGGSINIMGGAYGDGGSINMSNNGGSINTSGVAPDIGGSINTSGGGGINTSDFGGGIDTSDSGGGIDTSDGGGSINTKGVGSIQFGVSNTRTTLNGSATEARTITLPNATGTVALTSDSRFTDSRTPTAHTHAMSDVTSLQSTLIAFAIALG